jgi:hypothetical protein
VSFPLHEQERDREKQYFFHLAIESLREILAEEDNVRLHQSAALLTARHFSCKDGL